MSIPPPNRLLLVEDNLSLAHSLQTGLSEAGYEVHHAAEVGQARSVLDTFKPQFVLLDLGLPDEDGSSLIPPLRALDSNPYILITSARDTEGDRVSGLDAGADDYLTKPFSFAELLARLRALQRRRAPASESMEIVLGCLHMDLMTRKVTCGGIALDLTPREYGLLAILARKAGEVVPREQLAREVWQSPKRFTPLDNLIEVNISRLRNKLAEAHCILRLHTVRGMGYQLEKPS